MSISADTKNRLGYALASAAAGNEVADAMDANTNLADGKFIIGDVNGVQAEKTLSGDITSDREGVTTIGAGKVTNAKITANAVDATVAKNLASGDVIAGLVSMFEQTIADASADTDITITHKCRVIRFEFLNTGIGAHATLDTVQLKSTATAITDAVAKTATVNKLVSAATYDPAQVVVAAGGILRITAVKNTNVAGVAYITVVRSA